MRTEEELTQCLKQDLIKLKEESTRHLKCHLKSQQDKDLAIEKLRSRMNEISELKKQLRESHEETAISAGRELKTSQQLANLQKSHAQLMQAHADAAKERDAL